LLGVGADIAARLLGDEWSNAWLTNVTWPGFARWMEYRPLTGDWFERQVEIDSDLVFPYGFDVSDP